MFCLLPTLFSCQKWDGTPRGLEEKGTTVNSKTAKRAEPGKRTWMEGTMLQGSMENMQGGSTTWPVRGDFVGKLTEQGTMMITKSYATTVEKKMCTIKKANMGNKGKDKTALQSG
ncbi:hypothetical protein MHYP_G00258860 [Metynnis hypsauchen]